MPETANSILSKPLARLKSLIAASSTFQTLVGAGSATDALAHIYVHEANDESNALPRAIISQPEDFAMDKFGVASFAGRTGLRMSFEMEIPATETTAEHRQNYFMNRVGGIESDMQVLAGQGEDFNHSGETYLNAIGFNIESGPGEYQREEQDYDNDAGDDLPIWGIDMLVEVMM